MNKSKEVRIEEFLIDRILFLSVEDYFSFVLEEKRLPRKYIDILYGVSKAMVYYPDEGIQIAFLGKEVLYSISRFCGFFASDSIENALSDFVKAGLLHKIDSGVYFANPWIFGRVNWQADHLKTIFFDREDGQIHPVYSALEDGEMDSVGMFQKRDG